MDDLDRRIVLATQAGLPLVPRPYHAVAEKVGVDAATVMARLAAMQARGVIRRIAAVPNHYALGYRANGMAVWDVGDEWVDELGERIGRLPEVSHCYRRARCLPEWPYNLYVMLHGRDRAAVEERARAISGLIGGAARAHAILFSTRILKKTGLRLAGPEV